MVQLLTLGLLALQALPALGLAVPQQEFRCGSEHAPAEFLKVAHSMATPQFKVLAKPAVTSIVVNTYFHVVTSNAKNGSVTQAQLNNQLTVLNKSYNPSGVSFVLAGIDFTSNDAWATGNSDDQMKPALRKGTYKDLNVYFLSDLGGGLLGICHFPTNAPVGSNAFNVDGCNVLAQSVPGGTATNFNLGGTATHEIGHWFGLLHVFQGSSCSGPGDSIDDTPAQSTSTSGCPANKDSCPGVPGLDAIHNYMDYSYDSCYTEFTPNQKTRIFDMWTQFRAGH